jgi:hypothetical protein
MKQLDYTTTAMGTKLQEIHMLRFVYVHKIYDIHVVEYYTDWDSVHEAVKARRAVVTVRTGLLSSSQGHVKQKSVTWYYSTRHNSITEQSGRPPIITTGSLSSLLLSRIADNLIETRRLEKKDIPVRE